jgi:ABC-type multidrug transport system fused ATPase/permease subunit
VIICIAQFALISTGAGYLALSLPILLLTVFLIQKFYLSTSRQLRLLDLEWKSPLYTALTETIDGLATIRAYGWSGAFEREFLSRLDDSQRPVYMLYCTQRWLGLVLDLIVAALALLLMALATQVPGISSGPALGVAMVSVLGFGQSLSQFIVYYTELETSLGAIARIREYTMGIVPEDWPEEDARETVPAGWPEKGEVRFEKVCAAYGPEDEPILKDVSFEVLPGQVVGICGRSGR